MDAETVRDVLNLLRGSFRVICYENHADLSHNALIMLDNTEMRGVFLARVVAEFYDERLNQKILAAAVLVEESIIFIFCELAITKIGVPILSRKKAACAAWKFRPTMLSCEHNSRGPRPIKA